MNFSTSLLRVLAFLAERVFFAFKPNAGGKTFTWRALFVVFAHPGFVYRHLWRRRGA